jgi:multiple sugar transport system ATP-binding protein
MAEIIISNLRKEFGSFTAVKSSSFKIEDGEFFMLLGPRVAARPRHCA